jgi:hypothetical protein
VNSGVSGDGDSDDDDDDDGESQQQRRDSRANKSAKILARAVAIFGYQI